jgi:hypothetical protein
MKSIIIVAVTILIGTIMPIMVTDITVMGAGIIIEIKGVYCKVQLPSPLEAWRSPLPCQLLEVPTDESSQCTIKRFNVEIFYERISSGKTSCCCNITSTLIFVKAHDERDV